MKRFLRLFKEYRRLKKNASWWEKQACKSETAIGELQKKAESDAALIESLNRHIAALEGRDAERLARISFFEEQCREHLETIRELKGHLSGVTPNDAPQ